VANCALVSRTDIIWIPVAYMAILLLLFIIMYAEYYMEDGRDARRDINYCYYYCREH